ncbi:GrpB family protein [Actinosynnema sp. NPDC023587]|uniref:GrpB family protein n=1 Tax=Actinosynnema sp. NPDC023587 TaxID=3154695 RepID=UPI0033DAFDCE
MVGDRFVSTEEEIVAAHVAPPARLDGRVVVVEYDPAWPGLFEREAARVRAALGGVVVALEHVGSTSVPGLAAKPIIDVLLVVADSSDESVYVPPLAAVGYVLRVREPEWHEHRLFKGPDTDVNLHVFSDGDSQVRWMRTFRDWLRTHEGDRGRYEAVKRELSARDWEFVQNYADAKNAVVDEIMARAVPDGSLKRD